MPQQLPPSIPPSTPRQRPSRRESDNLRPTPAHNRDEAPPSIPPRRKRERHDDSAAAAMPPSFPPSPRPARSPSASQGAASHSSAPRSAPPAFAPRSPRPTPVPPEHRTSRPPVAPRTPPTRNKRRGRRWPLILPVVLLLVLLAWPAYLLSWANGQISHVDALSGAPSTSGTTWLIAGSDRRSDGSDGGIVDPTTEGARTDSLLLVRRVNGQASIVSLPRDSAVTIPGKGLNKLNAAYSLGGPQLLVATVEQLTGTKVDHYVEVSMGAVTKIVDAVGGVELCSDLTVDDPKSGLTWSPGCHTVDGQTALAFSRMRYQDPKGDIGRAERQRQVIDKVVNTALSPSSALNPVTQRSLGKAVATSLLTDPDTGVTSLGLLAWNYRKAQSAGLTGAPPLSSLNYRDGVHGSMVQIDPAKAPGFWQAFRDGTLDPSLYYHPAG